MLNNCLTSVCSSQMSTDYPKYLVRYATFRTFAASNVWNSESKANLFELCRVVTDEDIVNRQN